MATRAGIVVKTRDGRFVSTESMARELLDILLEKKPEPDKDAEDVKKQSARIPTWIRPKFNRRKEMEKTKRMSSSHPEFYSESKSSAHMQRMLSDKEKQIEIGTEIEKEHFTKGGKPKDRTPRAVARKSDRRKLLPHKEKARWRR